MNPEKGGPVEVKETFKVSTAFHSFRLEWKIPSKTIFNYNHVPRKVSTVPPPVQIQYGYNTDETPKIVENSKPFHFKDLKIHPFYLELSKRLKHKISYEVKLVTKDTKYGIKLNYAFVSSGDRLYHLSCEHPSYHCMDYMKDRQATYQVLRAIANQQKYVTIVCQVMAECDVQTAEDIGSLSMECSFLQKDSKHHYGASTLTSFSSSGLEALIKHSLSGELPNLTVDLTQMILEAPAEWSNAELKALSVEFLMKNLSSENVVSVWTLACKHNVQDLIKECSEYMIKYCKVTDKRQ